MLRAIGGTLGGIVVAVLVILLVERIGHIFYPMPGDVDMTDPGAVGLALGAAPLAAKLIVVGAWFVGALVGALVAGLISRAYWPGWIVAGFVALGGILNIVLIPHPVWMQIAAVAAPLLGGLVAHHVGPARRSRRPA